MILATFIAIAVIFYLGVKLKDRLPKSFCAICAAVSSVWIILLGARTFGLFSNNILLAVLVGESVVGSYYLLESKSSRSLKIFRVPVLLTLTYLGLVIVTLGLYLETAVFIAVLWLVHSTLYVQRYNPKIKNKINKLIECCRNW